MSSGLGEMIINRLTPALANLSDSIYNSHLWSGLVVGETWGPKCLVLGLVYNFKGYRPIEKKEIVEMWRLVAPLYDSARKPPG